MTSYRIPATVVVEWPASRPGPSPEQAAAAVAAIVRAYPAPAAILRGRWPPAEYGGPVLRVELAGDPVPGGDPLTPSPADAAADRASG